MNKLRYSHYDIVMQEVPNETTLAIDITGCPYKCPGCHSPFLWEYFGDILIDNLESLILKYKDDQVATNQRFYKIKDRELLDITYKFQEKKY